MSDGDPMSEIRTGFHQQLDDIRRDLIRVAARVVERITQGTEALLDLDLAAAQAIIEGDDEIDALTLDIEDRCFTVLALQQPMAGDLRAVVTAIRLTSEIERSADLMVNVAKATRRLYGAEVPAPVRGLLQTMATEAARLYQRALEAYGKGDATLAGALDDMDDRLDQAHKDYVQVILGLDVELQVAVQLALVGRYYERIGDHAVNIGQRVQYMVTGWLPEHAGAARYAARVAARREEVEATPVVEASTDRALPPRRGEAPPAEERLAGALDMIPQGVVVFGPGQTVVFRNHVAAGYLKARHGEALVDEAVNELASEVLASGGNLTPTRTLELFGPPRRTIVLQAAVLDQPPAGLGAVVVIDDVTDRRRLEAVRRDFVANISHELKTPVGALGLLAETLVAEEDPEVARRLAERILGEAFRVAHTIDDLLELSRIEVADDIAREDVPVHQLIGEAVDRVRGAAEQLGIAIEVDAADGPLVVPGDRRQLVSATYNLLDNAVKYSDRGASVQVTARTVGDWVEIEVRDHGVGIPQRDTERVFERFYRVDRARSRETGGTGLGLAIVRHVAGNHAGEVRVASREGAGSTFTLRLPKSAGAPSGEGS